MAQPALRKATLSPCTANYILRKTADDDLSDTMFSCATNEAVKQNFYMNDPLKEEKYKKEK